MENKHKELENYEKSCGNIRDVTLCYLINKKDNKVLIAMKKRGFGVGKWNGIGGKCEPGESIEKTLIREAEEEIGVRPISYKKVAEIKFFFQKRRRAIRTRKSMCFLQINREEL